MPINDKQQAFINEYMINGHNASQAYKKAYPNTHSGWDAHAARLIVKDSIKDEIANRMAENKAEIGRTVKSLDLMQQRAYDLAMQIKQPSAAVSAGTAIARLYNLDQPADADKAPDLTPAEIELLKQEGRILTGPKLAREA